MQEPNNPTPIAEYELWLEREKEFNHLIEQLKSPFAGIVLGKLNNTHTIYIHSCI